jgi:predicted RNA-binding Zn-ribbon protein involved in translation (DUF1610 family)
MDFLDVIVPILPMCGLLILVLLIGVAFNALWLKLMYRQIRACPSCGAKAAGEIVDTQEIVIANNVDHRGRKPVRIKETKVSDQYQCEVCGHTWTRSFIQKERIRMDQVNRRS